MYESASIPTGGSPQGSRMDTLQVPPRPGETPMQRRSQMFHLPSGLSFGRYSFNAMGYRKMEEEELQPRASILLPHLQQSEKKFFELVAANDLPAVKEFLQENHGFNINCVNFQGVSALHIAVQNRFDQMVEFLLQQRDIDIGDCALHAIRDNQIKIMVMLLDQLQKIAPGLEFVGATHSSDFPDHMTPLILASQCGHFEIIELLIERGHKIIKPHHPNCRCHECKSHLDHDDLLHAETLRLNLYRAISNPSYICHSTHDPILTAFELSAEMNMCSTMVPEFKAAYLELSLEISTFAVDLIGCCRNTEEMDLILRQRNGLDTIGQFIYPRLMLAMDYKQKQFVAHPNTQQLVETAWHGDFYEWKFKSTLVKTCYPFLRVIMLPIVAILCLVMPRHSLVKTYSLPLNKMLTHTASYLIFLVIIFLESNMNKKGMKRGPPHSGLEPVIVVWVVGIIWSSFRICMIRGPTRHFSRMWNWFDVTTYILYILTFSFWIASSIDIQQNDQVDLERKYWHELDFTLLAEGTFAVAVVMSFFRLMHLIRLHTLIGPLQICLGKMSADIAKFLAIFALIILAFTCGTCRLYSYYDGMVQIDKSSGTAQIKSQASSFTSFKSALKTYFWAIFCMSDLASGEVVIEMLPGEVENTFITNEHKFTETVGYIAFAIFEIVIVVILLNMLIATMSNTYQRVIDNVDIEWTFGKTDIYMEYMAQTTLPPPLNLIPTASGIGMVIDWMQVLTKNPPDKKARFTLNHCCFVEKEVDEHLVRDFPILMTQIIQRYFREKEVSAVNAAGELDQLKQEIVEIRQILKDSMAPPRIPDEPTEEF